MYRPLLSLSLCLPLLLTNVQAASSVSAKTSVSARGSVAVGSITVKKGDTLYSLARKNNLTVQQLRDLNGIQGNTIAVGQVLKLGPVPAGTPPPIPALPAQARPASRTTPSAALQRNARGEVVYTVKRGDTLSLIAARHRTTTAHLRALNGLNSSALRAGQVLKLTGSPVRTSLAKPTPVKSGAAQLQAAASSRAKTSKAPSQVAQAASTRSASSSAVKWYTVKSGDTLGKIAERHAITVRHIQALNGLTGTVISVGQQLKLSGNTPKLPARTPVPARAATAAKVQATRYTVKRGDTLGVIASRYGVSVSAIQHANNLKSDVIAVGQRLSIPARGTRPAARLPALPPGMEARLVYSYERVNRGETPSSFAARFGSTAAQVRQLNGLSTINQIMPGAKLLVPRRLAVPRPPNPVAQPLRYRNVNVQGINVQVVRVDLRHRDVLVTPVLPRRGMSFGSGATVRTLTASSGARALVNGSYFHPHTYAPAGDIVMQGRLLTWGRIPAVLAITPDNRASIQNTGRGLFTRPNDYTWQGMETVIASGPRIVSGGVVASSFSRVFQDPAVFSAASRSAIGLSSSRDLMLVSTHAKVSVTQMGRIMAFLGARDALLLDGGSSAGISWNGSVLLDSVRKVSYGIGVFTNYTGRRYAR